MLGIVVEQAMPVKRKWGVVKSLVIVRRALRSYEYFPVLTTRVDSLEVG